MFDLQHISDVPEADLGWSFVRVHTLFIPRTIFQHVRIVWLLLIVWLQVGTFLCLPVCNSRRPCKLTYCGFNKSAPAYISHPTAHLRLCNPPKTCPKSQPSSHPSPAEKIRSRCINVHKTPPEDFATIGCLRFHVRDWNKQTEVGNWKERAARAQSRSPVSSQKQLLELFSCREAAALCTVVGRNVFNVTYLSYRRRSATYIYVFAACTRFHFSSMTLVQQPSVLKRLYPKICLFASLCSRSSAKLSQSALFFEDEECLSSL